MKQHITKEQWDELSDDEKNIFENTGAMDCTCSRCQENLSALPSIGMMIEFLGDDYHKALLVSYYIADDEYVPINELCDALWEAVKYKLRNETNS